MAYSDSGHRPHASFKGERPVANPITRGPEALQVTLDAWGPQENLFPAMYDALQANWGNAPSRRAVEACRCDFSADSWEHRTGWCRLSRSERDYVTKAFKGETLPQILEAPSFMFTIDGCSRATTHQLVRTRLGAAFMQHGGRDNDWRHRPWTMPETIERACASDDMGLNKMGGRAADISCIDNWEPIEELLCNWADMQGLRSAPPSLRDAIDWYLENGRALYAALVDGGIPWQDARRLLWMGTQTYIHVTYNYLALKGVLANRLEPIMDWEINCVAQLLMREVNMKCPPLLSRFLGSRSDLAGADMFAGLESWPPSGKFPNVHERCRICGHAKANHAGSPARCEACLRESSRDLPQAYHEYVPYDTLTRTHRADQNPFWILHPESMAGSPIVGWVATNGTWPETIPPLDRCTVYGRKALQ